MAAIASSQESLPSHRRFPTGTYDYYGYASWETLTSTSAVASKLLPAVREGKFAEALPKLQKAWAANPTDLDLLQALAESARRTGKTTEIINFIAQEARRTTGIRDKFPRHYAMAFQYVLGIRAYEFNENESGFKVASSLGNGPAEFYYGRLGDDAVALDEENPTSVMMYVSSLWARGEVGEPRRIARRILDRNPDFYQLRLFLSATLGQGISEHWQGNVRIKVEEDERSNPALGLKEAEAVIRRFPDVIQAYYLAGAYARLSDPNKARVYLTHFVEKSKPGTLRYIHARHFLAQLGKKKGR